MTAHVLDVSERVYHADEFDEFTGGQPTLSSSIGRAILQSPRNAWALHPRLGNRKRVVPWLEQKASTRRGSIMHAAMLGRMDEFAIAEFDDWRTKAARAFRDQSLEDGQLPILEHELREAVALGLELTAELSRSGVDLSSGHSEMTILHRIEDMDPIWIRTRLDHVSMDGRIVITDLKTRSGSFEDDDLLREVIKRGYHVQQAAYAEAATAAWPEMEGRIEFQFAFLQLEPIPDARVVPLDGALRELGARQWNAAKERWALCLATNEWPGYSHDASTLHADPWLVRKYNL